RTARTLVHAFFFDRPRPHRHLHSFPTRRSSDLEKRFRALGVKLERGKLLAHPGATDGPVPNRVTFLSPFDRLVHDRARTEALWEDRKSTRLNSSHRTISYAVFCLKKKKYDRTCR